MPTIERLGNVGLYVQGVDVMMRYKEVLGLHITDIDEKAGLYFLARGLMRSTTNSSFAPAVRRPRMRFCLQQVAFKCPSPDDVIEFCGCLVEVEAKIEYTVTHGNAIAVYFYDLDGNRAEVYWVLA